MDSDKARRFIGQLMANQQRIYAFILTLVPNWADADDLMQQTAQVMWCRFEESEPVRNFVSWGMRIAQNNIMNYYAKKRRERVLFDDDLLKNMMQETEVVCTNADVRIEALRRCLRKLREKDRKLIRTLYEQGLTIKQLATQVERPVQGLYKAIARIHNSLLQCVRRSLALRETA
jgi:RNA polymerase sigma-70 factor (ECF subfamily)